MKMNFTAYNPDSGEKIKLFEHRYNDRYGTKFYYCDGSENFAYNLLEKRLFELSDYNSVMQVMIAKKIYYLIGEN
ncbi:hypothetical protein QZK48_11190 [Acinetobacter baumannii]|nr:hypothetical protein [Acinetobacter baumannii]